MAHKYRPIEFRSSFTSAETPQATGEIVALKYLFILENHIKKFGSIITLGGAKTQMRKERREKLKKTTIKNSGIQTTLGYLRNL